ncbi:MAG: hypothetical protein PHT78_00590 [Desulfitobacteriaceae bacterium]|nr:hypothetical protein [Desulfitobacteriaceae bacterium]MDD4751740.1 hypothetical protein [Desulfitobacteriaceae bacterium]
MSKGVVIFVEGDTEEEFFAKMLDIIHDLCDGGRFPLAKVVVRNLKGFGKYKSKAQRVFTNEILSRNKGVTFTVILCHDTDVFDFSPKPPVNWTEVKKILRENGAAKVIQVKAKRSIEDWFLKDMSGLCKYLGLPNGTKCSGENGQKKLGNLFRKANRVYIKGNKVVGLVDALNVRKIMTVICDDIKPLCKALGIKCSGDKC